MTWSQKSRNPPDGQSKRVGLLRFTMVQAQPWGLLSGWPDDRATYVGLAAFFTFFERIFQTRFLPFRFRVLRLNFLPETASM